jgi:hypothetical protein
VIAALIAGLIIGVPVACWCVTGAGTSRKPVSRLWHR